MYIYVLGGVDWCRYESLRSIVVANMLHRFFSHVAGFGNSATRKNNVVLASLANINHFCPTIRESMAKIGDSMRPKSNGTGWFGFVLYFYLYLLCMFDWVLSVFVDAP